MRLAAKRGFSILEAIVVLAITSLALLLVFSIGSKAEQTGFRLGRRALGLADAEVSTESLRVLLRGLIIPPPHPGALITPNFSGHPDRLEAAASLARETPCAPAGPDGIVTLAIEHRGADTVLTCRTDRSEPNTLMVLGHRNAAFTYSLDGAHWIDQLTLSGAADISSPAIGAKLEGVESRRVWVRLATDDNRLQVVETLSSGLPPPDTTEPL